MYLIAPNICQFVKESLLYGSKKEFFQSSNAALREKGQRELNGVNLFEKIFYECIISTQQCCDHSMRNINDDNVRKGDM